MSLKMSAIIINQIVALFNVAIACYQVINGNYGLMIFNMMLAICSLLVVIIVVLINKN
ncbi:MAG: hypothetical protein ACRCX2_33660 [Paraclostridium sp.]